MPARLLLLLLALLAPGPLRFSGPAEVWLAGIVSTEASEIKPAFSPRGDRVLWGSTNRRGGPGGWDIWETVRTAGGWRKPRPVSFNSAGNDFDPCFAPDGSAVYFFSNRPGGLGGDDLYVAPFDAARGTYGAAVNLGPTVNSPGDEWAPLLSPDGQRLIFSSNGRGGRGGQDLWVARRDQDRWQPPEPLPGAVNSAMDEFDAALLHDGRTLVFTRKAPATEGCDLWVAALGAASHGAASYGEPQRLGPEVNAAGDWNLGPAINLAEPGILYFSSHRRDAGQGRTDIYRIRYAAAPER